MNTKKWSIGFLIGALVLLLLLGGLTVAIDPFFHYHGPLPGLQYPIDNQRYQNNGIIRHFDYDAMITGTSMTENFRASELDALFGVSSIKVPFGGATFTELNQNIRLSIESNPDLKLVLSSIDAWQLGEPAGAMRTDAEYPLYLYDRNVLNDVAYVLNKEVLLGSTIPVLRHTLSGGTTTSFDDYSFWGATEGPLAPGRENVLHNNPRGSTLDVDYPLTDDRRQRLITSLTENTIRIAEENPHIQFYYFFPPYSILYWDQEFRHGKLEATLDQLTLASQLLAPIENIHLFAFYHDYDRITDLDNYSDRIHYSPQINSLILQNMACNEGRLTKENVDDYWQAVSDFYTTFDYDRFYREVTANED